MTTQIPPDFEQRHRLALALCEHLDINPDQVELGTLRIELGPDARHIVTWTGRTRIDLDELSALILTARLGPDLDQPNQP